MREQKPTGPIFWFFIILFVISFFLFGWLVQPFFSIIVLAAVTAGVFKPIFNFLNLKDRLNKPFASLLACTLLFFVIFIPVVFFVGILAEEAFDLYVLAKNAVKDDQIRNLLANNRAYEKVTFLLSKVNIKITSEELIRPVSKLGEYVGLYLFEKANFIVANALKFLAGSCLMLLVIYYLLIDGERLIDFMVDLSPLPRDQDEMLINKFKHMAGAILVGNGLGGLIQGTAGGIVFAMVGIRSPFLWGFIMCFLAFLPIVGIGMVFVPASILMILKGNFGLGLFLLVFYVVLSWGVEYLLKPKLIGDKVRMHTLVVFFSIMGGLNLFGLLGIIYGPLIATLFLTLTDIYHTSYRDLIAPLD